MRWESALTKQCFTSTFPYFPIFPMQSQNFGATRRMYALQVFLVMLSEFDTDVRNTVVLRLTQPFIYPMLIK